MDAYYPLEFPFYLFGIYIILHNNALFVLHVVDVWKLEKINST